MPELIHPYAGLQGGEWLRGNLHTHTTRSDGALTPQERIADYARRGHGFLMLSDHDLVATAEDYACLDPHGLVLIPGNEITGTTQHVLHVNAGRRIDPHLPRQAVFDAVAADQGFAIVNHPNWYASFDHCSIADLQAWTGYTGIEIYNGTIGRLDGSPYATNKWDMLLSRGRRVWGYAHDDAHKAEADVGLGWNTAYVTQRDVAGVIAALQHGRFYASTGVEIQEIAVEGMRIRVKTANARRIVALMQTARRFAQVDAAEIEVEVPANATYVRFECWGDGESFAWTQPFFVES